MIDKEVLHSKCFGCEACLYSCPVQAIKMKRDSNGFDYPSVDYNLCIDCGNCKRVCPSINQYQSKPHLPKVFSLRIKDKEVLFNSTSGGFFTILSDYVLERNGYVCGAIFDSSFSVKHIISNLPTERDKMRGAKYCKSNIGECFKKIKEVLEKGNLVLFSGTPCQNHSLLLFLKKKYKNLINVDIVCHGVPSLKYWEDYLKFISKKYGEIDNIIFRSKKLGWRGNNLEIFFKNGKIVFGNKDLNLYTSLYGSGYLMRENCFSCPYASVFRIADFSIGDCWGIEKLDSKLNDNKGCSLVFVNNDEAKQIFESLTSKMIIEERIIPDILQPQLYKPTKKPKDYEKKQQELLTKAFKS